MAYHDHGSAELEAVGPVLHWYDFVCPFCYLGQDRSAVLAERGFTVTSLPYQIDPEIRRRVLSRARVPDRCTSSSRMKRVR